MNRNIGNIALYGAHIGKLIPNGSVELVGFVSEIAAGRYLLLYDEKAM